MKRIIIKIPTTVSLQRNIIVILCCVFFVLKMIRAFSGSTVAGGVWNYIQILFVIIGSIVLLKNCVRLLSNKIFISLLLYTIFSMINGSFFLEINKYSLFSYLMIAYPICIFGLICKDACFREIENNRAIAITFYIISNIFIISMLSGGIYSTSTGAVADVYYILGLLPLMMVYTKKYKIIPFMVCAVAILISGKRAGIVLFVVMLVLYYFLESLKSKDIKRAFWSVVKLCIVLIAFLWIFILVSEKFNVNLLHRIRIMVYERDSSGRNVLRDKIMKEMELSNILFWIIGHGDGAAARAIGINVHNDFLETLYNFGAISCVSYIMFYVNCILEIFQMMREKYKYTAPFVMSIVCSLGLSMFSFYVIDPTYITCGMISIGYFIIDFRKKCLINSKILKVK